MPRLCPSKSEHVDKHEVTLLRTASEAQKPCVGVLSSPNVSRQRLTVRSSNMHLKDENMQGGVLPTAMIHSTPSPIASLWSQLLESCTCGSSEEGTTHTYSSPEVNSTKRNNRGPLGQGIRSSKNNTSLFSASFEKPRTVTIQTIEDRSPLMLASGRGWPSAMPPKSRVMDSGTSFFDAPLRPLKE